METQSERDLVAEVTSRLRRRFPHLSDEELEPMVKSTLAGYDDSKVRDFVPILAEREVVAQLRRRAHTLGPAEQLTADV